MVNLSRLRGVDDTLLFISGICIFAFFVKADFPLNSIAFLGLVIAGWKMALQLSSFHTIVITFRLSIKRRNLLFLFIGILMGILIGVFYRDHLTVPIFPETLTPFAVVAALIGATEELIFRGYLQGIIEKFKVGLAIFVSSAAHMFYKALLFISPFALQQIDVGFLVIWTFGIGLFFGWLTKVSKSVIPALIAHAIFDVWVYGQLDAAPWWVW